VLYAENKSHISEDICFYITADNHKWSYLFDCGRARYLKNHECKTLKAIFITHTHIDHFCNFDTLLRHQISCGRTFTICGPPGLAKNVQAKTLSYTWNLIKRKSICYKIVEVEPKGIRTFVIYPPKWELEEVESDKLDDSVCFNEDGITVEYTSLDHKIPSIAYLIKEDSKINIKDFPFKPGPAIKLLKDAYNNQNDNLEIEFEKGKLMKASDLYHCLYEKKGAHIGYAMDHLASVGNHRKLIKLWKNADEVIIEGFFRDCDKQYANKHFHSTVTESGNVARLANAKKMTLVHHSRRYFTELDDLLEEGYAAFENREPNYKIQPTAKFEGEDSLDE
jgi:ribonuclease Z